MEPKIFESTPACVLLLHVASLRVQVSEGNYFERSRGPVEDQGLRDER